MNHKVTICGVDTGSLPKLGREETRRLLELSKAGDEAARERLAMGNVRLVLSLVQRFRNRNNSDDLFQVGMVGLMKAVENFDTRFNVAFSTYAVPMIIGEIKRFLKDSSGIKVSRSMRDIAYKALHAKEILEGERGRVPTETEIAAEIDIPLKEVVCALDAVSEPIYLQDNVFGDSDDGLSLEDRIGDDKNTADNWNDNICLKEAIRELPDRERNVIKLRYFLGKTQTEISRETGISQAQVSRLEKAALAKIKNKF